MHSIFATALRARILFREPAASGLKFPGGDKPDYWDFVYFSFVIGMTFQVSDVAITSRNIRRTVIGARHCVVPVQRGLAGDHDQYRGQRDLELNKAHSPLNQL